MSGGKQTTNLVTSSYFLTGWFQFEYFKLKVIDMNIKFPIYYPILKSLDYYDNRYTTFRFIFSR